MFYRNLHFSLLLILLPALYTGFYPGKIVLVSFFSMNLYLFFLIHYKKQWSFDDFEGKKIIIFYVLFLLFSFIRGFWNIDSWRDYISLLEGFFTIIFFPCWMLMAKKNFLPIIWKSSMTLGLVMCLINLIYIPTDGMMTMAHNIIWLNIFIFLYSYIKRKYFFLIVCMALMVVFYDLNRRSIMLGYLVPIMILCFYRFIKYVFIRKLIFIASLIIPLVLLAAFGKGSFNIFEYIESQNSEYRVSEDGRAYFVDSRTGIYKDVFNDIFNAKESWKSYIGLGYNGKVRTLVNNQSSFGFQGYRSSQESGMLNYIQWGGIVGLFVYALLFGGSAYFSLFKSRNNLMSMIGYFILFRYMYSFVEDPLTYNAHSFYHFLLLGMGYNKSLRMMNDKELKKYFRCFLDIRPFYKTLLGLQKRKNIE